MTVDLRAPEFSVTDSGERITYAGGMLKEANDKPCPTLIPPALLWRLADHMTKGAKKYERDNWKKASSEEELSGFRDSAFRHLIQWLEGDQDEDHAAAICFNVFAAEHVRSKLDHDH